MPKLAILYILIFSNLKISSQAKYVWKSVPETEVFTFDKWPNNVERIHNGSQNFFCLGWIDCASNYAIASSGYMLYVWDMNELFDIG